MTNAEVTPQTPEFDLADRCMKARRVAGLSQQELAERTGISTRTITRYENGEVGRASKLVLRPWAFACGVSYEWLLTGTDQESMSPRNSTRSNRNRRGGVRPGDNRPGGTRQTPAPSGDTLPIAS